MSEKPKYEKMSKSKGNVVRPEEVVWGVANLDPKYEFRDFDGTIIEDYKKWGIWQDHFSNHCFFTSTRSGKAPVYLCEKAPGGTPPEEISPCVLRIDPLWLEFSGDDSTEPKEVIQHEGCVQYYALVKDSKFVSKDDLSNDDSVV